MKKVLVVDDKHDVWDEYVGNFSNHDIELTIIGIDEAPLEYSSLLNFDKVIVHDHGDHGNAFSGRVEFELLGTDSFQNPVQILIVNNAPDVTLQKIRDRWERFSEFFQIQAFYRLPLLPELVLSTMKNDHEPAENFGWFESLRFPARLINSTTGNLVTNEDWTWPENAPSPRSSDGDRSIVIFPSEEDNLSYRIVSSQLTDEIALQAAFPMEGPSQDPSDIQDAVMRQLREFGFSRGRMYMIRRVPESYPSLELVSQFGGKEISKETLGEIRESARINLGLSENGSLSLELDKKSTDLVDDVCDRCKHAPLRARASKAYETSSNRIIREFHRVLDISDEAEILYVSFVDEQNAVRGLLAADNGNNGLKRVSVLNLSRNLETIQRLLYGFAESIGTRESKRRASLVHKSRECLEITGSEGTADSFAAMARKFLRLSFDIHPVSLAVLAWTKGSNLSPYVVAMEVDENFYTTEEIAALKNLELTVVRSEELPAVYHAAEGETDSFFLRGLDGQQYPQDLNGHRPRCAFPLMMDGKMRGVVGISMPRDHSRLFANDVAQLKTIWEVATPTLFYLDQIRSYSERIDITRHDIANTADRIAALLPEVLDGFVSQMITEELADLTGLDRFLATTDAGTMYAEAFNPTEILNDALVFLKKVSEQQRKKIEVEQSVFDLNVIGDQDLYRSAARNIIKNAITHGDRVGHPEWLTISVRQYVDKNHHVLEVLNPGCIDRSPPEAAAGYRKGSQKALILLEKMLQPYHASIELRDEIEVNELPHVKASLRWPLRDF